MKRGYDVTGSDKSWAVPVVAHTAREAKCVAWKGWHDELACEWTDVRVLWYKDAATDGLPFGVVESGGWR